MSEKKCGIYIIKNNKNNLVYIGQSVDIRRRMNEHFSFCFKDKALIDCAIAEHPEDFSWEILKECPREELNDWETYYIYYYDSMNHGYNREFGGHFSVMHIGEKKHSALYTDEQMLEIRKEYVYTPLKELYEKYGKKNISLDSFRNSVLRRYSNLPIYHKRQKKWTYPSDWNGDILEVNTGSFSGLSVEEIMAVRRLSVNHSIDEILSSDASKPFKNRMHLREAINGKIFSWLPFYSKVEAKWIYPANWDGEKEKDYTNQEDVFLKFIFCKAPDVGKGRKLSNYEIIKIRVLFQQGKSSSQILKELKLEGKTTTKNLWLINKGKTYNYLPYYDFSNHWVFPQSFSQEQKEKFLQIISNMGDE